MVRMETVCRPSGLLERRSDDLRVGLVGIDQAHEASDRRHRLPDYLQALGRQSHAAQRHAGNVPAGSRQACYEAGFDRRADRGHHDRDLASRLHRSAQGRRKPHDDHIDLEVGELFRSASEDVDRVVAAADLEADALALDMAQSGQRLAQVADELRRVARIEHADDGHPWLGDGGDWRDSEPGREGDEGTALHGGVISYSERHIGEK